jgi:hypothetical protein
MGLKEFLETDEYILISKLVNTRMVLENREFVKAIFITSKCSDDKCLLKEITTILDQCYHGFYKAIDKYCTAKDCNTLLLLMKVASPYDIMYDIENHVNWGFSAARDYWLEKIEK